MRNPDNMKQIAENGDGDPVRTGGLQRSVFRFDAEFYAIARCDLAITLRTRDL